MFKLTSEQHGTYYCRSFDDAARLKAERLRLHSEAGFRIVELTPRSAEQRKQDSIAAFRSD